MAKNFRKCNAAGLRRRSQFAILDFGGRSLRTSRLPFPPEYRLKHPPILGSLGSASSLRNGFSGSAHVPLVKDGMNTPRFSRVEVRVQAIASREAANQLLCVSWRTFRRAYEEYPRWQALALWGEALIGMKGHAPSSVLTTRKKHCPGFIEARRRSQQFEPLALRLLEWAHTKRFRYAKEQSWLDALIFYGVRHPLSRGAWAYWEHCEKEWIESFQHRFPASGDGGTRRCSGRCATEPIAPRLPRRSKGISIGKL